VARLAPTRSGSGQPLGTLTAASVPTAIVEDPAGRVWVGTQDNFIVRVDHGRVTQVTKPAEPFRELRNINALACDATGRVWAATANGLAVHDDASDSFRTITPDDRTAQTVVIGLAAEDDGSMLAAIQSRGVERIAADGTTAVEIPADILHLSRVERVVRRMDRERGDRVAEVVGALLEPVGPRLDVQAVRAQALAALAGEMRQSGIAAIEGFAVPDKKALKGDRGSAAVPKEAADQWLELLSSSPPVPKLGGKAG
jgi:streptogramin lyase